MGEFIKVVVLHFDEVYCLYDRKIRRWGEEIDLRDIQETRYLCSWENLARIEKRLPDFGRCVTFIGKGDYHYVTYLFLKRLGTPFVLLILDNHLDMKKTFNGYISCGSWVREAAELLKLERVFFANDRIRGAIGDKITGCSFVSEEIKKLVGDMPLYVSIDKDILSKAYVDTNWDQGDLSPADIIEIIKSFPKEKFLGIDICGEPDGLSFYEHSRSEEINLMILRGIFEEK
ncbi:MAG: hypothetical protein N2317_01830 [Syntrophales bacterium]|nr:hypothetical protein [Syntrophales bacterium]